MPAPTLRTLLRTTGPLALALATTAASADVLLTGVYDSPATNPNQVDKSAAGPSSANAIDAAGFTALIAAGFADQTAGVITFDEGLQNDGSISNTSFSSARFGNTTDGPALFRIQRTVAGTNTQVDSAGNSRTPVSGNNGFGGQQSFGFNFLPEDGITAVGLTLLSRGGASDGTGSVVATFADADGSNPVQFTLSATIQSSDGGDDTFFGFQAPTDKFLQNLQINQAQFSWIDDLGVSTAVPEPGSLGLASAAGFLLLVRRRRD